MSFHVHEKTNIIKRVLSVVISIIPDHTRCRLPKKQNDGYRYHFLYYRELVFLYTCTKASLSFRFLSFSFRFEQFLIIKGKHVFTVWIIRFDGEARHCGIGHGLCITKEPKKVCASREGVRKQRKQREMVVSQHVLVFETPLRAQHRQKQMHL